MWVAEHPVPDEPSPKDQLQVKGETPPTALVVKLVLRSASVGFGPTLPVTDNLVLTANCWLALDVWPVESAALIIAVKFPADGYVWLTEHTVPEEPSPKDQLHV